MRISRQWHIHILKLALDFCSIFVILTAKIKMQPNLKYILLICLSEFDCIENMTIYMNAGGFCYEIIEIDHGTYMFLLHYNIMLQYFHLKIAGEIYQGVKCNENVTNTKSSNKLYISYELCLKH